MWTRFLLLFLVVGLLGAWVFHDWWQTVPADAPRTYVGTQSCIQCHQREANAWQGSHHDLAMDAATEETVLGNFDDATIEHYGITSRMYRDGDRFMVEAEGPDGEMQAFEVSHVFGVEPLQQYLVELEAPPEDAVPGALGRLQVLPFCWDTEGKRWFYLDPPDVNEQLAPDDPLHWTGYAQNWNHMCASCHSTNLQKGFDLESNRFATTFSDIDVGCEACHGPGSLHVSLAEANSLFWDRKQGKAITTFSDLRPQTEFETCAPCHSHRREVFPHFAGGEPYYDHYANAPIRADLYYPDGQIREEVYVLGSYMQSKMHAKGIRCSSCHDPHSNQLRFDDNRLCTSCHQHPAAKYDNPAHHQHPMGSTGAACVECHMPETPYMKIDLRRDHSMKVPRPDRSVSMGVPNACTGCHLDPERISEPTRARLEYYADWLQLAEEGNEEVQAELDRVNRWAAEQFQTWYGERRPDPYYDFAETLHDAWQGPPLSADQIDALGELATRRENAPIVRASALETMNRFGGASPEDAERFLGLLDARHPLIRGAAIDFMAPRATPAVRVKLLERLQDRSRYVRTRAAVALAGVPRNQLPVEDRARLDEALADHITTLKENGDQAGSHLSLGTLAEQRGADREAVQHYLDAIRVQPSVAGPRSNLANLLQRLGAEESAAQARAEELPLLERDAALVPNNMPAQYRLAMAYYLDGQLDRAEEVLLAALERDAAFADARYFLALLYDKQQRKAEAFAQAEALLELYPTDPRYLQLMQELKRP